jgi:hypothetical protein
MPESSKPEKVAILWSYDDEGGSQWLDASVKAIKAQGFVWLDVGWKVKFDKLTFPITGYIWSTHNKQVKYLAIIELGTTIVKQPDKRKAKEVENNWNQFGLPYGKNDRFHEYMRNERKEVTLLRPSKIEELNPALELSDFILTSGQYVQRPPQGANLVKLNKPY